MTIHEMARALGYKPQTVYARIRRGWTVTEALTTPTRPYFKEYQPIREEK